MTDKPTVQILYCHECGYLPDAVNMADKLLREFNRKLDGIKLVSGDGGAFEVSINGEVAYSKLATGSFPTLQELRDALRASVDASVAR